MSRKILSDLELTSGARLRGLLKAANDDEPTRWVDSFMRDRLAKTGAYTVVAADRGQYIDVTSGTWTLTLTAAATLGAGFAFVVFSSGSGVVTIDANASETIRDAAGSATTKTLAQGEGAFLNCDGSGWTMMTVKAGASGLKVIREFGAPDFDDPNNADWPIAVPAELTVDSINAGLYVRRFNDTAEEGVGFDVYLPTGATSINFVMLWRAQTTPGSTVGVQPSLRVREVYSSAAPEAWAETDMSPLSATVAQATNWQRSTQAITLSTLGLVAERSAHFELTRQPADADDTLVGDWVLLKLILEIT